MGTPAVAAVPLSNRVEGSGPPIVLLHGMGSDHTLWDRVIPELTPIGRVIAFDLRGHGRTPLPAPPSVTFDDLSADVLAALGGLGERSVHWVGFSGGALLALRLALDHPDRTRSLTMVCGAAYCDAHTRAITERWWSTYAQEGPDAFALRVLKDVYYPDWIEAHLEIADELRALAPKRDYAAAVAWGKATFSFDEKNRIAGLQTPTLIVQAMDDQVVDASHGRILRQTIPGAQIRILPQTGHMVPIERPHELAEAVTGLVRRAESAGPPTPGSG